MKFRMELGSLRQNFFRREPITSVMAAGLVNFLFRETSAPAIFLSPTSLVVQPDGGSRLVAWRVFGDAGEV